ncbi:MULTISPECIES: hypothetical protein [Nocardia]|uniref:Secreted protein n=2 Tax=Nocardia TaxID=1817 RepID=A0A4R6PSS0_NOCIG|nr:MULTISPECIES: hypothetical protein [Nocardia]NKX85712.1 hypothetical protein [Nocardia coubleae]TDP41070.1 hypothetical protein DFR75_101168 [Nocardia ignorata]
MKSLRKIAVATTAAGLIGASTMLAAPAQATPPGRCSANPVAATGAFSQCGDPVWHQVRVTCWAWWNWFSSYERYGQPAFHGFHSQTACDLPFSMQTWSVVVHP